MKDRQHFLDVLRVAAACAVVMMHTVTGVADNTDMSLYPMEQRVFLAVKDIVCWCVPVFIMISGYLFLDPSRQLTMSQIVTKYCRRAALALLVFGVPYAWVELIVTEGYFRPGMLWQGVIRVLSWQSWSHMWYLYLILFLYLLTPAIRWVLKRIPMSAVYLLLAALLVGSSILPFAMNLLEKQQSLLWRMSSELIYLFYYLCGYLFVCQKRWGKWQFALSAVLAAALAAGMTVSRLNGLSMQMAYNYPFTVLLSLCLFCAASAWGKSHPAKKTEPWESAARLCFAVYLIHPVFLNLAYKYFNVTPLSYFIGISLPLFFLGTLLLAAISAWLLLKIPILRKYVL